MSFFFKLDKELAEELDNSKERFDEGIKRLNSAEKDYLLQYMYKARHNLLVNLTEEKNKNVCLIIFIITCLFIKIIGIF